MDDINHKPLAPRGGVLVAAEADLPIDSNPTCDLVANDPNNRRSDPGSPSGGCLQVWINNGCVGGDRALQSILKAIADEAYAAGQAHAAYDSLPWHPDPPLEPHSSGLASVTGLEGAELELRCTILTLEIDAGLRLEPTAEQLKADGWL